MKKVRLLYACSGAADVGQIADLVARQLSKEKWGNMSCLAGIGADLSGFIESAREADNALDARTTAEDDSAGGVALAKQEEFAW